MTDEVDLVRHLRPSVSDDAEAIEQARAELMELIDPPRKATGARRWMTNRRIMATLGVAAMITVAATWALGPVETTTVLACHMPDDGISIVNAVTGDPVTDCRQVWWREYAMAPPPLVAYDNGTGGIEVVPDGAGVPSGWRKLASGVIQDLRLIELEEALGDVASGLQSGCIAHADAERMVNRELTRLALDTWSVASQSGETSSVGSCSYFYLDPEHQQVVLFGSSTPVASPRAVALATRLHEALAADCLTLGESLIITESLAQEVGLDASMNEVVIFTPSGGEGCARGHVNETTGAMHVILRGSE